METNYTITKCCSICNKDKALEDYHRNSKICKICFNEKRRSKYASDEEHRRKLIESATQFKIQKKLERHAILDAERKKFVEEHGEDKKLCKYCEKIVSKDRFRHNRLKCKDCERDDLYIKFTRGIRASIWNRLTKKTKHTIEYLGCNYQEYFQWLSYNFDGIFSFENWGPMWHVDHVIPLSKFDLSIEEQQHIAFNWRNTMPLLAKENLKKNNKIDILQIEQHYKKLVEYHTQHNIELPQEFVNLYATHSNCSGNPLEP